MESWQKENCVLYACTAVVTLGAIYISGSLWGLLGILMLVCAKGEE